MSLDARFEKILWEYDLSTIDIKSDIVWERIFSLADKDLSDFWISTVWKETAKSIFVRNLNNLDKKSQNYWWIIFWVDTKKALDSNKTMYEKLNKPIFSRNFG